MNTIERLTECTKRIGAMCGDGRQPRMSIPVREDDDDIFITMTCLRAAKEIHELRTELAAIKQQEPVAWDVEESVLAIHRILKSAASFSTREDALRSELKSVFQAGKAQPVQQEPCPDKERDEYTCKNRHQCWEPCGELGKSEEHTQLAPVQAKQLLEKVDEVQAQEQRKPCASMPRCSINGASMCKCGDVCNDLVDVYTDPQATLSIKPLTRSEKNRIWSSCGEAKTLSARASLFGTKIEQHHGIKEQP
jgi:hypothetical protein